ncbi:MAG: carbon-nitrogen hydrolase family protein [Myxococcota bacterium]
MSHAALRVATCQFPATADVAQNATHITTLMHQAAERGAHLVHFPEAALSGYFGSDLTTWEGYDWELLRRHTAGIQALAARLGLWTLLGSSHWLDEEHKPTNCLYVISPSGELVDRYDKSMLTDIDRLGYSAGVHPVTLDIRGVRCGLLICYDVCFPEMYARLRSLGTQVVFHSFQNAGFAEGNILDEMGHAWLRVRAADNQLWIVANNNSREHQCWPSCIARPDGSLAAVMERGATGMLVHDFPDDTLAGWTHNDKPLRLAPDETFHRGETTTHPRQRDRRARP